MQNRFANGFSFLNLSFQSKFNVIMVKFPSQVVICCRSICVLRSHYVLFSQLLFLYWTVDSHCSSIFRTRTELEKVGLDAELQVLQSAHPCSLMTS